MKRRTFLVSAGAWLAAGPSHAAPPLRIGLLLPLTGPEAEQGRSLQDAALLAVDEVNRMRHGRRLQVVSADAAGTRRQFARALDRLTGEQRAASIFGLCPWESRTDLLRLVEQRESLFWDPAPTPGGECSPYVVHGGPTPHQSLKNLVPWLAEQVGGRFLLVGTDLPWPTELLRVCQAMVAEIGAGMVAPPRLVPPGDADFAAEMARARRGEVDVMFAALTGESMIAFLRQYRAAGIDPLACPVASPTLSETVAAAAGAAATDAIAAAPYFPSWQSPANELFLQRLRRRAPARATPGAQTEAMWFQIHLFAAAVRRLDGGDIAPATVREAVRDCEVTAPQGIVRVEGPTLHTMLWPKIAVVEASGRFRVLARTAAPVPPLPFWAWPGKSCTANGLVLR